MHNVLIVDDQKSSRELMRYVVSENPEFVIVGTLDDSEKAKQFCVNNQVDLILMDIHTAGKENGIKNAKEVKNFNPEIKIILVTFMVQQEHIIKAREAGCEGFWYKDHGETKLIDVMQKVIVGEKVYPDKMPVIKIGFAKASDFTKQELVVLQLKVNGYSHSEICEHLAITRSTLNYHISNLKGKTGYDNMLKLAIDVSMKKFMIADEEMLHEHDDF